jgi:peptide/nickel transport system substrate-binding protein
MKRLLAVSVLSILLVGLIAACVAAPAAPAPAQEPAQTEAESAAEPAEAEEAAEVEEAAAEAEPVTLRLGLDVDAGTGDPRLAQDTSAFRLRELLYNGLVYIESDYSPTADLAESWENPDDKTWVFHLREGVKFHNGQEVTAEDVKYTYETILNEEFAAPLRAFYEPIQSIEVIDDHTVQFTLDAAYAPFLSFMDMGIVPKSVAEEQGEAFGTTPIGTGPFKFVEWQRGDTIELAAFDEHFNGRPKADRVLIKVVPDNSARAVAIESGDLDFIQSPVSPQDVARLETTDGVAVDRIPASGYTYINLNTADPILSDVRVRQALAHLVNREQILETIFKGIGQIANSPIPLGMWAYADDIQGYDYDPEKAQALLDEAGWQVGPDGIREKDGQPLALTVRTHSEDPDRRQIIEVLQAEFSNVGIQADTNVAEWPSYFADIQESNYQVAIIGWLNLTNPDRAMFRAFTIDGPANYGKYENAEVDKLILDARATLDQDEAKAMYQEASRIIAEEAPYIFLQYQEYIAIHDDDLEGFVPNPVVNWRSMKDVTIDQ